MMEHSTAGATHAYHFVTHWRVRARCEDVADALQNVVVKNS